MNEGFDIGVVVEHGYIHYKVIDVKTRIEIHCDMNELNKTIKELLMENIIR